MAKEMSFPRFIDRPRLFLMFEIDEVLYSLGVASIFATVVFFATMSPALMIFVYIFVVPVVFAIVRENKKKTGLRGTVDYLLYASGYGSNKPMSLKQMNIRWPELQRMENSDFVPYGFEDEFYS